MLLSGLSTVDARPEQPSAPVETSAMQATATAKLVNIAYPAVVFSEQPPAGQEVLARLSLENGSASYFIVGTAVTLGRISDKYERSLQGVDIDLGKSKLASRKHATITLDPFGQQWYLNCVGRNGLRINGQLMTPESPSVYLNSGDVIEIADNRFRFWVQQQSPVAVKAPAQLLAAPVQVEPSRSAATSAKTSTTASPEDIRKARHSLSSSSTAIAAQPLPQQPQQQEQHRVMADVRAKRRQSRSGIRVPPLPDHNNGVDYKSDFADRDLKPPYSYASLISEAILKAPNRKLTLAGVYQFMMDNYAYYRYFVPMGSWQNSVRHNLSISPLFIKVPRNDGQGGKGMYWTIDPQYLPEFNLENIPVQQEAPPLAQAPLAPAYFANQPQTYQPPLPAPPTSSELPMLPQQQQLTWSRPAMAPQPQMMLPLWYSSMMSSTSAPAMNFVYSNFAAPDTSKPGENAASKPQL